MNILEHLISYVFNIWINSSPTNHLLNIGFNRVINFTLFSSFRFIIWIWFPSIVIIIYEELSTFFGLCDLVLMFGESFNCKSRIPSLWGSSCSPFCIMLQPSCSTLTLMLFSHSLNCWFISSSNLPAFIFYGKKISFPSCCHIMGLWQSSPLPSSHGKLDLTMSFSSTS